MLGAFNAQLRVSQQDSPKLQTQTSLRTHNNDCVILYMQVCISTLHQRKHISTTRTTGTMATMVITTTTTSSSSSRLAGTIPTAW